MKKILFAASRVSHLTQFHTPYMKYYQKKGFEVHTLTQGKADFDFEVTQHDVVFEKAKPAKNIFVIKKVRTILKNEKIDIVITNATLSGLIVRVAVLLLIKKPTVIHSSHGYLFSKSTPRLKRTALLFIEKFFAPVTALCVTMNGEDYAYAKKYKLGKRIAFIRGMGIQARKEDAPTVNDTIKNDAVSESHESNTLQIPEQVQGDDYSIQKSISAPSAQTVTSPNTPPIEWREKLAIPPNAFVCLYAAEFSKRKNHAFLITAIAPLLRTNPAWYLVLAGTGTTLSDCKTLAHMLGLSSQIIFPGFVSPIRPLIASCNAVISVSKSEGLPFNIMEAMSEKKPILASNVKGNNDLIQDGETGFLFELTDSPKEPSPYPSDFSQKLTLLATNPLLCARLGDAAYEYIQNYTLDAVFESVCSCYAIADKSLL